MAGCQPVAQNFVEDFLTAQVVKLVEDLLRSLGKDISSSILVAFYDVEAALIGSDRLSNEVQAVDDSSDSKTRQYSQVLLLVGVPTGQVSLSSYSYWRAM